MLEFKELSFIHVKTGMNDDTFPVTVTRTGNDMGVTSVNVVLSGSNLYEPSANQYEGQHYLVQFAQGEVEKTIEIPVMQTGRQIEHIGLELINPLNETIGLKSESTATLHIPAEELDLFDGITPANLFPRTEPGIYFPQYLVDPQGNSVQTAFIGQPFVELTVPENADGSLNEFIDIEPGVDYQLAFSERKRNANFFAEGDTEKKDIIIPEPGLYLVAGFMRIDSGETTGFKSLFALDGVSGQVFARDDRFIQAEREVTLSISMPLAFNKGVNLQIFYRSEVADRIPANDINQYLFSVSCITPFIAGTV
jgi:hypothetical protein